MSKVMSNLKTAVGKNARVEIFERVLKLYEKSVFSKKKSAIDISRAAFEMVTLSFLESLRISMRQMAKLSLNDHGYDTEEYYDRGKFLGLITDLLEAGMITRHEYETVLKEPSESSLPWLLSSLKDEAEDLLSLLIIGHPGKIEEKVNKSELDKLLFADALRGDCQRRLA